MKPHRYLTNLLLLLPVLLSAQPLYLGSADREGAAGLYLTEFDAATGALSEPRRLTEVQPFFFQLSQDGRFLYASGHEGSSDTPAVLRSYAVATDHSLRLIDTRAFAGRIPLHLVLSKDNRFAVVANYLTPTAVTIPLRPNGNLGPIAAEVTLTGSSIHPERQDHSYPHSVNLSPDDRYAYVADRGTDRLGAYAFDAETGKLIPLKRPITARPGAGPRHLSWHPDGTRAYVINEINGSLTPYTYDATTGHLTEGPGYPTLATDDTATNFSAEVKVHPNGRFVYATNRGPNTIAVFAVGDGDHLKRIQIIPTGGDHPRYMVIDPSGKWLIVCNRFAHRVNVFALDPTTGLLTATEHGLDFPNPTDLKFAPSGAKNNK